MEVNDYELKNEMSFILNFCCLLSKTAPEDVKIIKEDCKNDCFGLLYDF